MDSLESYKRSLGQQYDEDRLHREVENGVAGYTGDIDRSYGFELTPSDLYVETTGDARAERLQDIEYELYEYFREPNPTDDEIEAVLMLEVEKVALREEIALGMVKQNPLDTERLMNKLEALSMDRAGALKTYLAANLMELEATGVPVDAEMYAEAELLGQFIADANPEETPEGLVLIARVVKDALDARLELGRFLSSV